MTVFPRRLGELLPEAMLPADLASIALSGLSQDSRDLRAGDVFVALRGAVSDGHDRIGEARAAGAVAALVERELPDPALPVVVVPGLRDRLGELAARCYGYPARKMHITAITGTNGKTTVCQLLAQLLRACGYGCGAIGTLGASIDGGVAESRHTTPDAVSLQRQLASWAQQALPFVAMEASSHALAQGRLDALDVDTAVFTNLSRDHLDYHGDMRAYGDAKAELLAFPSLRAAILNADDAFCAGLVDRIRDEVRVLRYGLQEQGCELRASRVEASEKGLRFRLSSPWGDGLVRTPLVGSFNVSNLLAALAAALEAGMPFDDVVEAAASLRPAPGRMEPLRLPAAPLVVVDYAHTPDALAKALETLRAQCPGRLIAVFGCGGDRDRGKRALMAEAVSAAADYAVVTSDNPRSEDPAAIVDEIAAAMHIPFERCVDRREAIRAALERADADDCVLIAGKGHETYQEIAGRRAPFSDLAVARELLEGVAA
ncbi:MAG: UDP-N-acetylmuramoyl-L-alanyl-D-glutamate--2,6-diaminopimelate ligase [Halieaceae bacterium]|jgi:UDP-N-acetylmuramoyl-L-alanyl-D-glutamate--2,6-diaminopimelate ligase|nr:UDP-N-acetylmuramoyl-L-alanyl-D-glutamate--2,6-diaminopimelate ligase [Halieaceae bacterium]